LILFNLQMPVRSGFEIMLALAASAADSDLPVIVIPAQSQKKPAFQASAWDFLSNPFGLLEC
jgi:CheY-like chemotaxis protein